MVRPASHLCVVLAACEKLAQHVSFGLQPMGDKLVFCPFSCWDFAISMPLCRGLSWFRKGTSKFSAPTETMLLLTPATPLSLWRAGEESWKHKR